MFERISNAGAVSSINDDLDIEQKLSPSPNINSRKNSSAMQKIRRSVYTNWSRNKNLTTTGSKFFTAYHLCHFSKHQHLGQRERKSHRHDQNVRKMKLSWAGHINHFRDDSVTTWLETTRQVEMTSGGEMTWTHSGDTQRKTA